ncbi:hypothetical protein H4R35_004003 [Dimargaris xerosporica]|nr:hypothetical protein H4R35_004003 [Dimargaris xerosporica]
MTHRATAYDEQSYWETRFDREDHFDWLGTYDTFAPILDRVVRSTDNVLHVGCGTSNIAFALLLERGVRRIANVDYCANVIAKMQTKCQQVCAEHGFELVSADTIITASTASGRGSTGTAEQASSLLPALPPAQAAISWHVADCMAMASYPALQHQAPGTSGHRAPFDVVLDKSLTDCISCGDDDKGTKLTQLAAQIGQLLQPYGHWVVMSYSESRNFSQLAPALADYRWEATRHVVPGPEPPPNATRAAFAPTIYYYCYVCQKVPKDQDQAPTTD